MHRRSNAVGLHHALLAMPTPIARLVPAGSSSSLARVVSDDAVEVDGRPVAVEITVIDASTFLVTADGSRHLVHLVMDGARGCLAMVAGRALEVERSAVARPVGPRVPDDDPLSAPMPATVTKVLVQTGDTVSKGDTLVRLEAMKMELAVRAPHDARVTSVSCRDGELVQPGRPLVTLA